ncbi:MAG: PIN domain-containing protein [Methanobrevibacter sp.]|nr:PIN domain-containing protein [Methanobrevibacter sp.]
MKTNKYHERALEIAKNIKNQEKIISKLVIAEVITVLNIKLKQDKKILSYVYEDLNGNYTILNDTEVYDKAMNEILKFKKRIPFFDCVYMALMEDLRINEIASFDEHFDNRKEIVRIH